MAEDDKNVGEANDPLQLSDLALRWMIDELDALPLIHKHDQIIWNDHKDTFIRNYDSKVSTAEQAPMHDLLKFGGPGKVPYIKTFMWHILGMLLQQLTTVC